jgi:hypothetical protein
MARRSHAACAAVFLVACELVAGSGLPPALPTKLGLYDYQTQESSPVIFNGRFLMMESMIVGDPEWSGPSGCRSTYFRVRDQSTGSVVVNISSTCGMAFGSAWVATNDEGLDTLYIYGTTGRFTGACWGTGVNCRCVLPRGTEDVACGWGRGCPERGTRMLWSLPNLLTHDASCALPDSVPRSIDAFYSSDPALSDASWHHSPHVLMPGRSVYNQDVAHVGAPTVSFSSSAASSSSGSPPAPPSASSSSARAGVSPVLPPHQWVMIMEADFSNGGHQFAVSNLADPTDSSGWVGLDYSVFRTDPLAGWQVGACPSIRFDPSTSWYYLLTGGNTIFLLRSQNLTTGSWQLASVPGGGIIVPDASDCVAGGAPWAAWYSPSPLAAALMQNCTKGVPPFNTSQGFGNDSDVDLTDVVIGAVECSGFAASGVLARSPAMAALCANVTATGTPQLATVFQYGTGDQRSFGFSNLAIAPGRMFDVLASYF